MSLWDIQIESEYRNLHGNIIRNFYNPLLSEAIAYDRSVGFFSSTALSCFSVGLCNFLKNGGKIRLVATPYLSTEDIQAMRDGYKVRNEIIENALVRNLFEPANGKEVDRLNMLANLIAEYRMDIKIALTKAGMYHEKLGIIEDSDGNFVAFSGSSNESENAFLNNYESTDVFCSWKEFEKDRALKKKKSFEKIWNGTDDALEILDFPKLKDEIIRRYKKSAPKFDMDEDVSYEPPRLGEMNLGETTANYSPLVKKNAPTMPKWFEENIYDYQKEAIENWAKCDFCGIFDMATGTGKTLTGLGALVKCAEKNNNILATFIVVPYQHLVEQWVEDVEKFNIKPIVAYSTSPQSNWKDRLKKAVRDQRIRSKEKGFFCCVTTNATFKSSFMQEQIDNVSKNILLIVDEAHNIGTSNSQRFLDSRFRYRLALSATLDRHKDVDGTAFLYSYFGKVCISYTLEKAIAEGKLTPYKYKPILVYFTDDELSEYKQISNEILLHVTQKNGKVELDPYGEYLAIKRSRIVAGANNKLDAFRKEIEAYKEKENILVYCGATTTNLDEDSCKYDNCESQTEERQIVAITKILGNEMNMKVARFTSEEDIVQRQMICQKFKEGDLQAIVAIKCLDEGVNIPSIKTAFILASTTNPKEYIQRRGRVLRKCAGKSFAEIYDFVTLPRNLQQVSNFSKEELKADFSLVKNELRRIKEFSRLSDNEIDSLDLITCIQDAYHITDKDLND